VSACNFISNLHPGREYQRKCGARRDIAFNEFSSDQATQIAQVRLLGISSLLEHKMQSLHLLVLILLPQMRGNPTQPLMELIR